MFIDVVFLIFMVSAIFKGYNKGLIVALFSVAGFIIGIAAALKLSAVVAQYMAESTGSHAKWLPILAFVGIIMVTMMLVRMLAAFVQKTFETVMLGWVNRLGGILLYVFLYAILFSVILFYARQLSFIDDATAMSSSTVYPYLKPLGPTIIEGFGVIIPWFKNVFGELKDFFGNIAK